VKEDIVHILCVGHFVIRAKHSLELKGQVIWDLSLSGRYLPQSTTQPQNYDQSESKKTHVMSLNEKYPGYFEDRNSFGSIEYIVWASVFMVECASSHTNQRFLGTRHCQQPICPISPQKGHSHIILISIEPQRWGSGNRIRTSTRSLSGLSLVAT